MKKIVNSLREVEVITVDQLTDLKLIGYIPQSSKSEQDDFCILKRLESYRYAFISIKDGSLGVRFPGKTAEEAIQNALKAGRIVYQFNSMKEFAEHLFQNRK